MKKIRLFSLISLFCCLFVACKYDIHQLFFRGPAIDERASSITEIQSPPLHQAGKFDLPLLRISIMAAKRTEVKPRSLHLWLHVCPLIF